MRRAFFSFSFLHLYPPPRAQSRQIFFNLKFVYVDEVSTSLSNKFTASIFQMSFWWRRANFKRDYRSDVIIFHEEWFLLLLLFFLLVFIACNFITHQHNWNPTLVLSFVQHPFADPFESSSRALSLITNSWEFLVVFIHHHHHHHHHYY